MVVVGSGIRVIASIVIMAEKERSRNQDKRTDGYGNEDQHRAPQIVKVQMKIGIKE
jgi:hypothetical protein